jgi:hypothetical protein
MRPESRNDLLTAIAKAQGWIDAIRFGRSASFRRGCRARSLKVTPSMKRKAGSAFALQ